MSEVVLSATGIHKSYKMGSTALPVLKGVDLDLSAGELVTIVGASGSGKSTLLHVLGLLDPPDQGQLQLGAVNLMSVSDRKRSLHRRRDFGFVFQFYHLFPELTAYENVELAGRMGSEDVDRSTRRKRTEELLERVELVERRRHRPSQLSGGEKQRVAIARAIFHRPRVLFCDEPTGNLDRGTGKRVWKLIEALRREENTTMLVVTHDEQIASSGDRQLRLEDGLLSSQRPVQSAE